MKEEQTTPLVGGDTDGISEPEKRTENQATKTFTQDEVNEIVQKRLSRERETRLTQGAAGQLAKELAQREDELVLRERKLLARERLASLALPCDAAELLDYSSDESVERSLEKVSTLLQVSEQNAVDRILREHAWTPEPSPTHTASSEDPLRNAFLQRL